MFIRELQSLLLCTECHNLTAAEEKTLPRAAQSKPALSRSSMSGSDAVDFFDVVFRRDDFLSTKLIHSLCSSSTNYMYMYQVCEILKLWYQLLKKVVLHHKPFRWLWGFLWFGRWHSWNHWFRWCFPHWSLAAPPTTRTFNTSVVGDVTPLS